MKLDTNQLVHRMIALEAKIDPLLFGPGFRKPSDDPDDPDGLDIGGIAKGTAVGAGAVGGYLAHRAVMDAYGSNAAGSMSAPSVVDAYKNLGRNVARSATDTGAKAVTAVKAALPEVADAAKGIAGDVVASGKKYLSPLLKRIPMITAESGETLTDRMVALNARLGTIQL